jgi:transposase
LAERFGRLARFRLTGGQVNDSTEAIALTEPLPAGMLTADRAYNTVAIVEHLQSHGVAANIPNFRRAQIQRPIDIEQYKARNRIERLFCQLKQFRRVATRYDKLAERFGSFVALSAVVLWLR